MRRRRSSNASCGTSTWKGRISTAVWTVVLMKSLQSQRAAWLNLLSRCGISPDTTPGFTPAKWLFERESPLYADFSRKTKVFSRPSLCVCLTATNVLKRNRACDLLYGGSLVCTELRTEGRSHHASQGH